MPTRLFSAKISALLMKASSSVSAAKRASAISRAFSSRGRSASVEGISTGSAFLPAYSSKVGFFTNWAANQAPLSPFSTSAGVMLSKIWAVDMPRYFSPSASKSRYTVTE